MLFLGAGVHAPAPPGSKWDYPANVAPPFGGDLSATLAAESGYAIDYPKASARELPRVAMHYELSQYKNRLSLVERIKKEIVDAKRPSPILRALGELNFPLVVTTNYDHFFEKSLPSRKTPEFRVYQPNLLVDLPTIDFTDDLTETKPGIIKIHGDFANPESLVITDEDYIHFIMRMRDQGDFHPFPLSAQTNIQRNPTLFLGYSLLDYNMRLFLKTLRFRRTLSPQGYSIDPYPDSMIRTVWQDQRRWVWFVSEDVWSFVPCLYKKVTGRDFE